MFLGIKNGSCTNDLSDTDLSNRKVGDKPQAIDRDQDIVGRKIF